MEPGKQVNTVDTVTQSPKGNTNNNLRARIWSFTLNNHTEQETKDLTEFVEKECVYWVWQPEKGKSGTPHLQGMFEFKNPRTFNALHKKFPRMHLEKAKKREALIKYCKKEDTKVGPTVEGGTIFEIPDAEQIWLDILKMRMKAQEQLEKMAERIAEEIVNKNLTLKK